MASCSKVMATTTASAILYQQGYLDINAPVSKYLGSRYEQNGKANVTVLNCLLHNAGYPPDPVPGYWQDTACPKNKLLHPPQNFECSHLIYERLLAQTLDAPVNSVYVYSDLSFITLSYVVGSVVYSNSLVPRSSLLRSCSEHHSEHDLGRLYLCYFEAYVRVNVFGNLGLKHTRYLPLPETWSLYPPTRIDTWYRHAPSQGYVDDENAYAMGGISGHAGVYSNLDDIFVLMQAWMEGTREDLLNATTVKLWRTEYNHTQSSRALGWNTNDPNAPDRGWNLTCGKLSSSTFLHIGYTGTQICADPENEILTLLLTNRVYPTGANTKIQRVRQLWNDAVAKQFNLIVEPE
jgi:CubicO group peptidase (beta-lactamase class C family)